MVYIIAVMVARLPVGVLTTGFFITGRRPKEGEVEHELKIWRQYYESIIDGHKTFELRKDDRGYKVGDVLRLREWASVSVGDGQGYTGREVRVAVVYVLRSGVALGLEPGYCVLGIRRSMRALDAA